MHLSKMVKKQHGPAAQLNNTGKCGEGLRLGRPAYARPRVFQRVLRRIFRLNKLRWNHSIHSGLT